MEERLSLVRKFNKKGVSSVVATVSLVLITFAAVAAIAGFVIPFVSDNLSSSSECFPYRNHFTFEEEFGYNCYEQNGAERTYAISVRAGTIDDEKDAALSGFSLSFIEGGSTEVVEVVEGAPAEEIEMLNPGFSSIDVPSAGEVRTYVFVSERNFESVEVYPKLKTGRLCEETDRISLRDEVCQEALS